LVLAPAAINYSSTLSYLTYKLTHHSMLLRSIYFHPRAQQKPAQCGNAAASKNNTFASNLEFPAQGSTLSSAGLKLEKNVAEPAGSVRPRRVQSPSSVCRRCREREQHPAVVVGGARARRFFISLFLCLQLIASLTLSAITSWLAGQVKPPPLHACDAGPSCSLIIIIVAI
jgi:hypothetical protein